MSETIDKLARSAELKRDKLHNLIPVTLGNAVGGAVFIGFAFWLSERTAQKN